MKVPSLPSRSEVKASLCSVPSLFSVILLIALAAIFFPASDDPELRDYPCQPLDADSTGSAYLLPYQRGTRHRVNQANCSGRGHSRFWNHGYDFKMTIGTPVLAARDGNVIAANDGCKDGDRRCTNLITVRHTDGSVALYSHLTKGGVQVVKGQTVRAGQLIGHSGETGNTGGLPHLHFSVHPCGALPGLAPHGICPSQPVNFRNTEHNPHGLMAAHVYRAE
ncbi:M23 family metallopeptidase [Massilia sp. S19_KUP03_FR1]|uniref:M23 family metallopeptidase n=1 Tax=Massilia sp. S19_KUP03_FR1 TaxID=3025503 RepID=UPI002FCDD101